MHKTTNRRNFFRQFTQPEFKKPPTTRRSSLNSQEEASRFLAQATLGADRPLIEQVAAQGIENWLDVQLTTPQSQVLDYVYANTYEESMISIESPWRELFRYAFMDIIMNGADLLRQRVALALSEIFVISTEADAIYGTANGVAHWYDMLLRNAFGNFRDLLQDVTMHPVMGHYLSHAGNRKTNVAENRFPDENYAREIMQLFTIGLFMLNDDGSFILDGEEPIPTYDNSHITEFAKIFTGLTYDFDGDPHVTWTPDFNSGWLNPYTAVRPMTMWDEEHESGSKTLLNRYVVPNGQTGLEDLNDALDHLFNHQNVGPFIGRLLIQRLVKSNPSPGYISRITAVFNNNGSGVRGDMQAVIKAILMDDEARNLNNITDPTNGKLREPFFRFTHLLRAFNFSNPQGKFWDSGWAVQTELRQHMFNAPSVFNFFSPDYRPPGPAAAAGLAAPEFQLLNSYTTISTINFTYAKLEWDYVMDLPADDQVIHGETHNIDQPTPDFSTEEAFVNNNDIDGLIDHLNLVLTYGSLSTELRNIIQTAVSDYADTNPEAYRVVRLAVLLFMISPEYAIQV